MNWDKIEKELQKIQKGLRARTLDLDDVKYAIEIGEKKLRILQVPKKYWKNSILQISPPKVANSYKYPANGIGMIATRLSNSWKINFKVMQCKKCPYGSSIEVTLELSELAQDNLPVYKLS